MDVRKKIWVVIDVGKASHHACAVDADGKVVFSSPVPNGQAGIEGVIARAEKAGEQMMWALDVISGVAAFAAGVAGRWPAGGPLRAWQVGQPDGQRVRLRGQIRRQGRQDNRRDRAAAR